jgi:hypothetical protein
MATSKSDAKYKEVRTFLNGLSEQHYRYLEIQLAMATDARNVIERFHLTPEQFCEFLEIKPKEYQSYINGGFNYDIKKMALLKVAYKKLLTEQNRKEIEKNTTGIKR